MSFFLFIERARCISSCSSNTFYCIFPAIVVVELRSDDGGDADKRIVAAVVDAVVDTWRCSFFMTRTFFRNYKAERHWVLKYAKPKPKKNSICAREIHGYALQVLVWYLPLSLKWNYSSVFHPFHLWFPKEADRNPFFHFPFPLKLWICIYFRQNHTSEGYIRHCWDKIEF